MIPDFSKMKRAEFCNHLANSAPQNSDEFWAFHAANHYYEAAECQREATTHGPNYDQAFRMRARRRYVKGCKLRDARLAAAHK